MKAMVFAAGLGTRLGDLTRETPKCLVEVAGKTMLEHVVIRLRAAGVDTIVVNLHHLGQQIRRFLELRDGLGVRMELIDEERLLDTGGGLYNARKFFDSDDCFIVHNSDVYSDIDLSALLDEHRCSGSVATLAVMQRDSNRYLLFDRDDRLCGWENPGDGRSSRIAGAPVDAQKFAFSGIQVLSSRIFDFMQDEPEAFSLIRSYIRAATEGQMVKAYRMDSSFWIDMGTPAKLDELRRVLGARSGA